MQITNDSVVTFDYVLTNDNGQILGTTEGSEPLSYLHGTAGVIAGLERAFTGKTLGDEFEVSLTPSEAYGERNEGLCRVVPRTDFDEPDELQPGMRFRVESESGWMIAIIVKVSEAEVTIDANHPLAGMNVHFAVKIRNVRKATKEEIEHGNEHSERSR